MKKEGLASEIIAEQRRVIREQIEFCERAKMQLCTFAADMEIRANELRKYLDGEGAENE